MDTENNSIDKSKIVILYWTEGWTVTVKVEVNFMDDVGQTLLNWASAFGTQEMVEFLCAKGADVNKGKKIYINQ